MAVANTPQFDWPRTTLENQARPVPPIYQPEVIVRTVVYGPDRPRRQSSWCGDATAVTPIGDRRLEAADVGAPSAGRARA